jgi:SAM-dependent methyltransferase
MRIAPGRDLLARDLADAGVPSPRLHAPSGTYGSVAVPTYVRQRYTSIHAAAGCGELYDKLYESGYEHAQWTQLEMPFLRALFRERFDAGARRLLDVACGTGRILGLAEEIFPTTWGVDVSQPMLDVARGRCRQSVLVRRDLAAAPLDERFDVVTAFRFFLGAEPELRDGVLKSIAAMLAPGGILIANIHVNSASPLGVAYRVLDRILPGREALTLARPDFERALAAQGFRVRQVHWYSYLPRTGQWLTWIPRYAMGPVERVCRMLPLVPQWIAQSFIVVCDATP